MDRLISMISGALFILSFSSCNVTLQSHDGGLYWKKRYVNVKNKHEKPTNQGKALEKIKTVEKNTGPATVKAESLDMENLPTPNLHTHNASPASPGKPVKQHAEKAAKTFDVNRGNEPKNKQINSFHENLFKIPDYNSSFNTILETVLIIIVVYVFAAYLSFLTILLAFGIESALEAIFFVFIVSVLLIWLIKEIF